MQSGRSSKLLTSQPWCWIPVDGDPIPFSRRRSKKAPLPVPINTMVEVEKIFDSGHGVAIKPELLTEGHSTGNQQWCVCVCDSHLVPPSNTSPNRLPRPPARCRGRRHSRVVCRRCDPKPTRPRRSKPVDVHLQMPPVHFSTSQL